MPQSLITPHGGTLVDPLVDAECATELRMASRCWPSWDLTPRQLCNLELLLNGGFSLLRGFMTRADYEAVCTSMRLANGSLWSMPITRDVSEELARRLGPGVTLALCDPEGVMLAALHVGEVWWPNRLAKAVYGTTNREHLGVAYLLERMHPYLVGRRLKGLQLPVRYDFRALRLTLVELRAKFARLGWRRVVAFQTRNPMHRAHQELTLRAAKQIEANLLIHAAVGMTKPGDVDHYTRVRCYQAILAHYPKQTVDLALLPLAICMAGPREAVWHAIIRKSYGCTDFIVGRDHAGPGSDSSGKSFYEPYAAQRLLREHEEEVGVRIVPFQMMVYVEELDTYFPEDEVPEGMWTLEYPRHGVAPAAGGGVRDPPLVHLPGGGGRAAAQLCPSPSQGFTVFFTGLSGAGKSTIANVLLVKFLDLGRRPVTLPDGDVVHKHLSSELGFSKEHRDLNIRRIGFVASEITKNGGIAICAPIAPYDAVRKEVRAMVEPGGGFVLVYVATPLEVCEQRDRKGLYAKARAGLIQQFTGISDPYEVPIDAEVVIDTSDLTPEETAQQIILHLEREGYIGANSGSR